MSDIIAECSGSILRVQLNRPARKNAMTSRPQRKSTSPLDQCPDQFRKAPSGCCSRRGYRRGNHNVGTLRLRVCGREREVPVAIHQFGTCAGVRKQLFDPDAYWVPSGGGIGSIGLAFRCPAGCGARTCNAGRAGPEFARHCKRNGAEVGGEGRRRSTGLQATNEASFPRCACSSSEIGERRIRNTRALS